MWFKLLLVITLQICYFNNILVTIPFLTTETANPRWRFKFEQYSEVGWMFRWEIVKGGPIRAVRYYGCCLSVMIPNLVARSLWVKRFLVKSQSWLLLNSLKSWCKSKWQNEWMNGSKWQKQTQESTNRVTCTLKMNWEDNSISELCTGQESKTQKQRFFFFYLILE